MGGGDGFVVIRPSKPNTDSVVVKATLLSKLPPSHDAGTKALVVDGRIMFCWWWRAAVVTYVRLIRPLSCAGPHKGTVVEVASAGRRNTAMCYLLDDAGKRVGSPCVATGCAGVEHACLSHGVSSFARPRTALGHSVLCTYTPPSEIRQPVLLPREFTPSRASHLRVLVVTQDRDCKLVMVVRCSLLTSESASGHDGQSVPHTAASALRVTEIMDAPPGVPVFSVCRSGVEELLLAWQPPAGDPFIVHLPCDATKPILQRSSIVPSPLPPGPVGVAALPRPGLMTSPSAIAVVGRAGEVVCLNFDASTLVPTSFHASFPHESNLVRLRVCSWCASL